MDYAKLQADFIELIENNKKLIYKVSHLYCDSTMDKKDLFQDIISNLWISYPNFQNKSKISTWIYRVSLNTAITWFRDYTKQVKRIEYTNLIPHLTTETDSLRLAKRWLRCLRRHRPLIIQTSDSDWSFEGDPSTESVPS